MAEISKITLPSGSTYDIKDATARELISSLGSPTNYLGVTTTEITDGSTTSSVTIGGTSHTAKSGDIVAYENSEFVWSDVEKKWREFGSTGSLKALAFKDNASAAYTPAGTIAQPTFTGTKTTLEVKTTAKGNVTIASRLYDPDLDETLGSLNGLPDGYYKPEGTISAPTVTVTANTASVKPFGSAGTLPSCTLPSMSATVANETLTLGWTAGSFSAGTLPTAGTAVTVATGIKSATVSTPTFNGTAAVLETKFTGEEQTTNVDYTPAGIVSKPTFTGMKATITVK